MSIMMRRLPALCVRVYVCVITLGLPPSFRAWGYRAHFMQ
jgi:hypothetical protein